MIFACGSTDAAAFKDIMYCCAARHLTDALDTATASYYSSGGCLGKILNA